MQKILNNLNFLKNGMEPQFAFLVQLWPISQLKGCDVEYVR